MGIMYNKVYVFLLYSYQITRTPLTPYTDLRTVLSGRAFKSIYGNMEMEMCFQNKFFFFSSFVLIFNAYHYQIKYFNANYAFL